MKKFFMFLIPVFLLTFAQTSCKKKSCKKEKSAYELLTSHDWHLFNEKVSTSSGSTELPQDIRFVFTRSGNYFYYNGSDTSYTESGTFELIDNDQKLKMTKTSGVEVIYTILKLDEHQMEWEYVSGNVTYTFYFEEY